MLTRRRHHFREVCVALAAFAVVLYAAGSVAASPSSERSRRPPAPRTLATTAGGTIAFGTPTTFTVSTANDTAWMTFDATAGMRVSMKTSMGGTWTSKILDPGGNTVASCKTNCNGGSNFIDTTPLASAGTYTVQLTASSAGNGTITLYNVPTDPAATATPVSGTGTPVTLALTTPGLNGSITFQGYPGQRFSWAQSGSIGAFATTLYDPLGVKIASCGWNCNGGSAFLDPVTLVATGTYTIVLDPSWDYKGTETVTLYDVPTDVARSTTPVSGSGASVSIPIGTPGQNATITFQGYAGERLSWAQSGSVGSYLTSLYDPNGTKIASCGWNCNGGSAFLEPVVFSLAGTYRIVFDPLYNNKGTETLKLYDVPQNVTIALAPISYSTQIPIQITTPGQNATITFSGSTGESLAWTQTGQIGAYGTYLYRPDGVRIASCGWNCNGGSASLGRTALPSNGTYKIAFDPFWDSVGSHTITLYLTPASISPPQIFGLADIGETLVLQPGTWIPPASSSSYQWLRCNSLGASCISLFGSTGTTYVVQDGDLGSTLRVRETATNQYGTTSADSKQTPIVLAALNDLAQAHRPTLLFDSAELWRPLEIDAFLNEYFQYRSPSVHQICDMTNWGGTQPGPCKPMTDPTNDMAVNNNSNSYLNISGDSPGELGSPYEDCWGVGLGTPLLNDCNSGLLSAIYYEPGQDTANYRYLDYWWFLRLNDEAGVSSCDLCQHDEHEGDWEGATIALDGAANSGAPPIAYVGYAAHDKFTWVTFDALGGGTRPNVYSATGTHASYPDPCPSDCHQPPGSFIDAEASHNGQAGWGNNDDTACAGACVKRFGEWWTRWNGRWGGNQGQLYEGQPWGWSPHSPGLQDRFLCAESGYTTCTRPPGSRIPQARHARRPPSPRVCAGWFGVDVAALACDARRLSSSLRHHLMRKPGRLHLAVRGRRAGDAPGIAQVLGQPLRPGERVSVNGRGSPDTVFILDLLVKRRYRATFTLRDLGVRGTRDAFIKTRVLVRSIRGRPVLRTPLRGIPAEVQLAR